MEFNLLLDKWAFWTLKGGVAAKAEISRIGSGDQVFAGECSNKKQGAELIDDDVFFKMHGIFLNLSTTDKEILLVHYRLLPTIPPLRSGKLKANYMGLRPSTYRKRLHTAKKNMQAEFESQQK